MHRYLIHPLRWLFVSVLLFSVQVLASPCKHCGKENKPGKDGQTFCRTCDSGKSAGATNSVTPFPDVYPLNYRVLPMVKNKNGEWISRYQFRSSFIDTIERGNGDAAAWALAVVIARELVENARLMGLAYPLEFEFQEEDRLQKLRKMVKRKQKQLHFLQKLHLAASNAGAGPAIIMKNPIHERAEALTRQRAETVNLSQWADLPAMGMHHLLTAEFHNSAMTMNLTPVFQAIQDGNMIQLIVTQTATDEGNQAAAATASPVMLAAILPAALTTCPYEQRESTDMHLLLGTLPQPINQHHLMNALTAIMNTVAENEQNADLSLHFFMTPNTYIQREDDFRLSCLHHAHRINSNLPLGGWSSMPK
ncbi:hypothetical protein [Endozoicomonas sp. 4G]|uniref:hypothetical protein n=1 Tax=Endozoicomonas sp. 4G TaxID=2872754 RepID=UPI00207863A1|nr:hypothetical protein [Endozoicomonas sp. 4G]